MDTLLLDPSTWDLIADAAGNIAAAHAPYALAQDAASQMKTFQGEVWYDTNLGIPYEQEILSQLPPISLVKYYLVAAAELTPDVVQAKAYITSTANRQIQGQVHILDDSGNVTAASFF